MSAEFDWEGYTIKVTGCFVHESDYGADADGNRGVSRTWLEDTVVKIYKDSVLIPEKDYDQHFSTKEVDMIYQEAEDALGEALDEYRSYGEE